MLPFGPLLLIGDQEESSVVRLSVYTVSPASSPTMEDGIPLLHARIDVSIR